MKAGRVARILLKVAAALAAGFVVSVGVAWGPLLIDGRGVPKKVLFAKDDFVVAVRLERVELERLRGTFADPATLASQADRCAVAIARFGTLVVARPMFGDWAQDAADRVGDPRTADWSIESGRSADDADFWDRQPSWITRGDPPDGSRYDYGAGWPWVVTYARGEPSRNWIDDDLWRRGWLGIGDQPVQDYGLAVPVRVHMRGAVLSSLFYGAVLFAIVEGAGSMRRRLRARRGRCPACGYDLAGNIAGRCPECGGEQVTTDPDLRRSASGPASGVVP